MLSKLPEDLQAILWSKDIHDVNLKKDKNYIIHQILAYGRWKDLLWLAKTYGYDQIYKTFITNPAKDYSERSFNFVQKVMLKVPDSLVDKRYYVKTYPRIIGQ